MVRIFLPYFVLLFPACSVWADGVLSIRFYEQVLQGVGLPLSDVAESAPPESPGYLGFATIDKSVLGGFRLGGKEVVLDLKPGLKTITFGDTFELKRAHRGLGRWMQGDLCLTAAAANRLGRPDHAGRVVGGADVVLPPELDPASFLPPAEKGGNCAAPFGPSIDVALTDINDIGAVGWDPGGRVALAPSAVLENIGENAVYWYWAIDPHGWNGTNVGEHPYLALHMYRLDDAEAGGGMVQIGVSDLKHAWNTVNYDCPCRGGQVMYPGCADVYGVLNNANQYYFAPRDELTAHSGAFETMGSHFDGTPVNDSRDHTDAPGEHATFDHRLTATRSDLLVPGARYFVEALYIARGDTNVWNSIGHREVTPTYELANDLWTFSFVDTFTQGPAITQLGGFETLDTGEGHLLLSSDVTDLGGGSNRYRYTLMNMDFDRQVSRLELPGAQGAISEFTFKDGDNLTANDWTATPGPVFSGPAVDWGRMVSIEFVSESRGLLGAATALAVEPSTNGMGPNVTLSATIIPQVLPTQVPSIGIDRATGNIRCSWNAVLGARYQLQVSTDTQTWTDRGVTITATGSTAEYIESPTESRLHYRVQLLSFAN